MENITMAESTTETILDKKINKISKRFKYLYTFILIPPIVLIVGVMGLFSFLANLLEGWGIIYALLIFALFAIFLVIPFILFFLWGIVNAIQAINLFNKNKEVFIQNPELGERAKNLKRRAWINIILISILFIPVITILFMVKGIF